MHASPPCQEPQTSKYCSAYTLERTAGEPALAQPAPAVPPGYKKKYDVTAILRDLGERLGFTLPERPASSAPTRSIRLTASATCPNAMSGKPPMTSASLFASYCLGLIYDSAEAPSYISPLNYAALLPFRPSVPPPVNARNTSWRWGSRVVTSAIVTPAWAMASSIRPARRRLRE